MFDLYFYYIACIKSLLKLDCLTKIKEDPLFTTRILKDCEQNILFLKKLSDFLSYLKQSEFEMEGRGRVTSLIQLL